MNPFKKLKKLLFRKKKSASPPEIVEPETGTCSSDSENTHPNIHNIDVILETVERQRDSLRFNAADSLRRSKRGRADDKVVRQLQTSLNLKRIHEGLKARKEDLEAFETNTQQSSYMARDNTAKIAMHFAQEIAAAISPSPEYYDLDDADLEKELAELLGAPSTDKLTPQTGLDDGSSSSCSKNENGELKSLEEWAKY